MTIPLRLVAFLLLGPLFAPFAAAQGGPLTLPGRVNGALTSSSEQVELTLANDIRPADRYTLTLSAGQAAIVRMESTAFDTYLKVFRNGEFYGRNDDFEGSRAVSQVNLTQPGDYVVFAGAFSGSANTGPYTISATDGSGSAPLSKLPTPTPPRAGRELTIPGRVQGQLTSTSERVELTLANDIRPADRYTFRLRAGQTATVRMESTAFDTYLKVFRDGAYHNRNDDHEGSREVSQVILSSPGEYTVLAGAFSGTTNTGPYELSVAVTGEAAPETSSPPTPSGGDGGTHEGTLTNDDAELPASILRPGRKADAFRVELHAGETLVVTMESNAFDTYLVLSLDDTVVAMNDDDGSTQRSRIEYRVPSGGEYMIYASSFTDSGRGSYTFTWYVE